MEQVAPGPVGIGKEHGHLLERRPRPVPLVARHQQQRQPLPGLARVGLHLHERLIDAHRLGPLAEGLNCHAQLQAGVEIVGPQPQRLLIARHRRRRIIERLPGIAEVAMRLGILRLEFERPPQQRDGLPWLPLAEKGGPEVVVGDRVVGCEPDRLAIAADRTGGLTADLQCAAEVQMQPGIVGPRLQADSEPGDRAGHIARVEVQDAERVVGGRE